MDLPNAFVSSIIPDNADLAANNGETAKTTGKFRGAGEDVGNKDWIKEHNVPPAKGREISPGQVNANVPRETSPSFWDNLWNGAAPLVQIHPTPINQLFGAPIDQVKQGAAELGTNPLAGAARMLNGAVGTGLNLTGIPVAMNYLPDATKNALMLPVTGAAKLEDYGERGLGWLADKLGIDGNMGMNPQTAAEATGAMHELNQNSAGLLGALLTGKITAGLKGNYSNPYDPNYKLMGKGTPSPDLTPFVPEFNPTGADVSSGIPPFAGAWNPQTGAMMDASFRNMDVPYTPAGRQINAPVVSNWLDATLPPMGSEARPFQLPDVTVTPDAGPSNPVAVNEGVRSSAPVVEASNGAPAAPDKPMTWSEFVRSEEKVDPRTIKANTPDHVRLYKAYGNYRRSFNALHDDATDRMAQEIEEKKKEVADAIDKGQVQAGTQSEHQGNSNVVQPNGEDRQQPSTQQTPGVSPSGGNSVQDAAGQVTPETTPTPQANPVSDEIKGKIDDAIEKTKADIQAHLKGGGNQLSSFIPLDPVLFGHYTKLGALYIGKGIVNFADWSAQMVADAGEAIKPHLKKIWDAAQEQVKSGLPFVQQEKPSGFAANINLDKLTSSDEIKSAILDYVHSHPEEVAEARAKRTLEEIKSGASKMKIPTVKVGTSGKAATSEEQYYIATRMKEASEEAVAAVKKAQETGSDDDRIDAEKKTAQANALWNAVIGFRAEAGRSLRVLADINDILDLDPLNPIRKFLLNAIRTSQDELAADMATLDPTAPDFTEKAREIIRRHYKFNIWDELSRIIQAGYLTSPATIGKILASHGVFLTVDQIAKFPSAVADYFVSRLFDSPRQVSIPTMESEWRSVKDAATKGIRDGLKILVKGNKTNEDIGVENINRIDIEEQYQNMRRIPTRWKLVNSYINTVGNVHEAAYRPLRQFALTEAMSEEARLKVINDGGDAKYWYDHPTPEMEANAIAATEEAIFTNQNGISDALSAFKKKLPGAGRPVATAVIPFTVIPVNVVARALDYSGIGGLYNGMKAARMLFAKAGIDPAFQRQLSLSLGRGATGIGLLAIGSMLAQKNLLTGYSPKSFEDQGRLTVGDKEAQVNQAVNPIGNILTLGATLQEANDGKNVNWLKTAGQTMNDLPLVRSSKEIADMAQGSSAAIGSLAGGIIPAGVAGLAGQMDDSERNRKTIMDYIQNRTPIWRQSLPSKDIPETNRLFDPFNTRQAGETAPRKERPFKAKKLR
ncbi:MAG: hypothetical protein KGJ13_02240 [Patescibacteria group bacterium]|nr:hypothetical protein [Patescibacteria group bacterium]